MVQPQNQAQFCSHVALTDAAEVPEAAGRSGGLPDPLPISRRNPYLSWQAYGATVRAVTRV